MDRRDALRRIASLAMVLASPSAATAQGAKAMPVIGFLDAGERLEWWEAFRQRLRDLGYTEGKNVAFEPRYAGGQYERLTGLAEELVRSKVSVNVTSGSAAAALAN